MLDFHIVIPARYASTRLPGKLLKPLANKPLLQHTYERALEAGAASVTIATDHEDIAKAMQDCGAKVLMTKPGHENGTDRIAEAVDLLGLADDSIVVNLQGDEPLMPATLLTQVAHNLAKHPAAAIATIAEPILHREELLNKAVTKVIFDKHGYALYFSRAPIPFDRDNVDERLVLAEYFRHLGLYAYRVSFLRAYQSLTPVAIENLEKLEQLRALYYGYKIHVERAKAYCPPGVDTQEDFDKIAALIA
ncbi:MAG: kdsB [Gammaproteobacteria bacterium]|jgi:3-deoxy-manno-octulosonate cytidylyltransferase (CMP-KDO synthetase)|nr:kdsB [Gammaproteobacteria bacterium]